MEGFPRRISTGQDLYNCLAMVKSGELPAEMLRREIERIEYVNNLHVPVKSISGKTATVNFCNEVTVGMTLQNSLKVTAVEVVKDENEQPQETIITFNKTVPADTAALVIPLPVSVYAELDITPEKMEQIKGDLARYE